MKITGVKLRHPLDPETEIGKKNGIRSTRGKQSAKPRASPVGNRDAQYPSTVGHFLGGPLGSCPMRIEGGFEGLDHWRSDWDGGGGGG